MTTESLPKTATVWEYTRCDGDSIWTAPPAVPEHDKLAPATAHPSRVRDEFSWLDSFRLWPAPHGSIPATCRVRSQSSEIDRNWWREVAEYLVYEWPGQDAPPWEPEP